MGNEENNDSLEEVTPIEPMSPIDTNSVEITNDDDPIITDESIDINIPETTATEPEKVINIDNKEPEIKPSLNEYKKHQVSYSYSSKVTNWKPDNVTISLPSNLEKETNDILEKLPNIDLSGGEEILNWGETLSEGMGNLSDLNQFVGTLNNPDSDFRQTIGYKGKDLGVSEIKTNFNSNHLTGEKAILAFSKALGVGDLIQTPLWASGIWVTLKTPTEAEMIRLNQELVDDKITQGRATKGLAFSNSMVYTIDRLARFAIDHIFDTTLQASALENKDIRDLILSQDYPTLVWGLICSMYPRGFQFRRACIDNPEKCNYVLEELLNPKKLLWVNYRALPESHMVHMSQRQHKIKTLESVLNYQSSLPIISDKTINVGDEESGLVKITLKSPNLNEYITAGQEWITGIVKIVDSIISKNPSDNINNSFTDNNSNSINNKERNKQIEKYSQSSSLRQISHWIKNIEINDYIVDDIDTMANVLSIMSQDDTKRVSLIEEVSKYIEETTLSVVGIPVYNCPKCKTTQGTESLNDEFKNIIPLDVTSIFFDQHVQRLMRIGQR